MKRGKLKLLTGKGVDGQNLDAAQAEKAAGLPGAAFRWLIAADGTLSLTFFTDDVHGLLGHDASGIGADPTLLFQAFEAEDRSRLRTALASADGAIDLDLRAVARDGGPRRLRVLARPTAQEGGTIAWDGFLLDLDAMFPAPGRDPLAAAIEHAGDSIEITDADFRIQYVNPAFERVTGYGRAEILGKTPGSVLRSGHFDDSYYETIENTVRAGRTWRGELIARRRDGDVRYQEATISPVTDAEGAITHFICVKRDVTQRRIAESALERARGALADAVESISDGLAMFDIDDRLVLHNRRFLDIHPFLPRDSSLKGLRFEELLRRGVAAGAFVDPDLDADPEGWIDARLHHHRRSKDQLIEQRLHDGRWMRVSERRTAAGGVVCVWADISELKQREAAVSEAKEAAERASQAKNMFLAHMSHELRTPLSAVVGFSELIVQEIDGPIGNDRYLQYARDIQWSGEHLCGIIDDILDVSRIEAGALDLADDRVDLQELSEDCLRLLRDRAAHDGLTIELSVARDLPPLRGDQRRLRQVLINLLSNARKYTRPGGRIRVEAGLDSDGFLLLSVADTGIGMTPAEIPEALTPFKRLDNELTRQQEGTGLGLPLAKTLVELHDGTLVIESEPGRGTIVTCRFPPARLSGD